MPSCSALALILALAAAVLPLPLDEISARNGVGSATSGVGGQAAGGSVSTAASNCTGPLTNCVASDFLDASLVKVASGKHTWIISLHITSDANDRKCGGRR